MFTPATLIVPGVGALAATVGISPFEITFYATMGMVAGDSVSFGLGRLVGNKLYDWVPDNYHGYIKQAQKFMGKYGVLSVALGRFFGPLRCVVPFTAGSLGMNKRVFFSCDYFICANMDFIVCLKWLLFGGCIYRIF